MIENGTELIVQGFEIHRRIRLAALIPTFDHLILPSDNVFGLDRVHFPLGEVREQFGANDVLFGVPSVLFQPVLHIGCVGVYKPYLFPYKLLLSRKKADNSYIYAEIVGFQIKMTSA